jgi:hypothetical protein
MALKRRDQIDAVERIEDHIRERMLDPRAAGNDPRV